VKVSAPWKPAAGRYVNEPSAFTTTVPPFALVASNESSAKVSPRYSTSLANRFPVIRTAGVGPAATPTSSVVLPTATYASGTAIGATFTEPGTRVVFGSIVSSKTTFCSVAPVVLSSRTR
jgi:hypothetical protein